MKKTLILTLSLAACLSARASNISLIDFGSFTPGGTVISAPVTLESGAPLSNGGIRVRLGYFNTAIQTGTWLADLRSNNVAQVNSAMQSFIPLGENAATPNFGDVPTTAGPRTLARNVNGVPNTPGRIAGGINNVNPAAGAPNTATPSGVPAGSRIYLLVYSDADSTLNLGEQFGVFSADNWLMPSDGGLHPVLNTIEADSAGEVFRGALNGTALRMAALVPEPTTGAMALLAGLGMLSRRRR